MIGFELYILCNKILNKLLIKTSKKSYVKLSAYFIAKKIDVGVLNIYFFRIQKLKNNLFLRS